MGLSREASQSLPSVAEKNVWSYMPNCSFAFMLCSETNCAENIALWSIVILYDCNGRFQNEILLTTQPANLNFCWEFCFIGTERLDWVEGRACSRFVTGVNIIIFCKFLLYIYIYKGELNGFIFHQYSTHSYLFIKLFYCLFCTIHATLYSNIFQQFRNYKCLHRTLQVYDTVWSGKFLITCCNLLQDINYHL